jgi:hypothetical protein
MSSFVDKSPYFEDLSASFKMLFKSIQNKRELFESGIFKSRIGLNPNLDFIVYYIHIGFNNNTNAFNYANNSGVNASAINNFYSNKSSLQTSIVNNENTGKALK